MLKLTREQLEIMRRRGASMRTPAKEAEPVPAPVPVASAPAEPQDDRIAQAIEKMAEAMAPQPAAKPTSWRFDIERDARGFTKSITAHPVARN